MSVTITDLVWKYGPTLQGNDLLVMLALAEYADDCGLCWPSVPALAEKARVSERTIRYILQRLEGRQLISIEQQRGRTHTNRYILNLQVLGEEKVQPVLQVIEPENLQQSLQVIEGLKPAIQSIKPASSDIKPAISVAPEPSIEPSIEPPIKHKTAAKNKSPSRKTTIPADFALTPERIAWAEKEGHTQYLDLHAETAEFIQYWTIGEGAGQKKLNWDLTWKGRIRSQAERIKQYRQAAQIANRRNGNGTNNGRGLPAERPAGKPEQPPGFRVERFDNTA